MSGKRIVRFEASLTDIKDVATEMPVTIPAAAKGEIVSVTFPVLGKVVLIINVEVEND